MSARAAKMLISVPFLHLKLRVSKIISAALVIFCLPSGIYLGRIQGVCHTTCLRKHITYVQTSNMLHQ